MGYRDDSEALRAKVEHLEQELARAHRELARLRGEHPAGAGATAWDGPGRFWLGAPSRLRMQRRLEGEVAADVHEELAELLHDAFDAEGRVSVLGGTLRWSLRPPAINRVVDVRIKSKDGSTQVQITERLGNIAGGLFGGIVGGVGGGGVTGVAMGAAALLGAWAAPLAGLLWVAGTYGAVRLGYRRLVARRAAQLGRALDALERLLRARVRRGAAKGAPAVRVAGAEVAPEGEPAERAGARRASRDEGTR